MIEPRDSGLPQAPFVIEGAPDGSTRIYGSIERDARPAAAADFTGTKPPATAVQVIDLGQLNNGQPLSLVPRGAYNGTPTSLFEIFSGDRRLRPSVWPRNGYAEGVASRAVDGSPGTHVRLPSSGFERFKGQKNLVLGGYWIADWAYEQQPVAAEDDAAGEFTISRFAATLPVRTTVRLRVLNAMSELDGPGNYVLDPANRRVFVVPGPGRPARFDIAVARELLVLPSVRNVTVRNIAFERTLGTPIRIENASGVTIENCLVRNSGNRGITVTGGRDVAIQRTVVTDIAETGILISGGDRRNLSAAGHRVVDSVITRFAQDSPTYRPGVEVQGVGNSVVGSYFRDAPHSAILVSGNEHRVTGNEISDVVKETNDAGAIYMGRDFTARGNAFTGNYIHDIGDASGKHRALIGIYLDDQFSGATITGNVFRRVTVPVQIGGGRDNVVSRNAFLESQRAAVLFDNRGENKHRQMVLTGDLHTKLMAMPFQQPLWASRYPSLATLPDNRIGVPLDNVVAQNVLLGRTMIEYESASSRPYLSDTGTIAVAMPPGATASTPTGELLKELAAGNPAVAQLDLTLADRAKGLHALTFLPAALPPPGQN